MEPNFDLPGYEIIRHLGSGGFGEVWQARQTGIDRMVAIKVGYTPLTDSEAKRRFESECRALGRVSGHPSIVTIYTVGQLESDRPYLVLEYVEGGTLHQLAQQEPIEEFVLTKIGAQVAKALQTAHEAGVLHRDLKPENIFLLSLIHI